MAEEACLPRPHSRVHGHVRRSVLCVRTFSISSDVAQSREQKHTHLRVLWTTSMNATLYTGWDSSMHPGDRGHVFTVRDVHVWCIGVGDRRFPSRDQAFSRCGKPAVIQSRVRHLRPPSFESPLPTERERRSPDGRAGRSSRSSEARDTPNPRVRHAENVQELL